MLNNKVVLLIFISFAFKLNLNCQILKEGMGSMGIQGRIYIDENQTLDNSFGPQFSFNHYRFSSNIGLNLDDKIQINGALLNADLHIWNWHHAYLAKRFVPIVGIQLENSKNANDANNWGLYPRVGIKGSFDRFIFEWVYLNNGKKQFFQSAISYVLWIGSNCSMKRVKESNKFNITEF